MIPILLSRTRPAHSWPMPLLYRTGMRTGLRALWNRARTVGLARPRSLAVLHGTTLEIPGLGPMRLAVHPRPTPKGEDPARRFAIISARQLGRKNQRLAYAYLLSTSHFGCGHLELGCFEVDGHLTFFGARNMALANASRFGRRWPNAEQLGTTETTATEFARTCQTALIEGGISTAWASPTECVRLSVQPGLIPPADRVRVQCRLTARYKRLHAALATLQPGSPCCDRPQVTDIAR